MRYGQRVLLVNNTNGTSNAAYGRVRRNEYPVYKVVWQNFYKTFVDARMVLKDGRLSSHTYTFPVSDLIVEDIAGKKLEDYL